MPAFDVARIEPTGEAVIAGRTTPGATVELLRNGELHDRAVADQSGQFVMVPPKLPAGTYDLTLRSREPDGKQTTSRQSVAVVIEPKATDRPVVALITPNKPTVVLSQPDSPKPTTGAVIVEAVEIEPGGKFHVSGRARAGATVRLYLNDSFVAPVTAGADGRFAVTINEGVAPGSYRVRVDELESNSSSVRARAEVPFNVPDQAATGSLPAQATASKRTDIAAAQQPQLAAAGGTVLPDGGSPSAVVVPKIATTTVSRGDTLWRLSQAHLWRGHALCHDLQGEPSSKSAIPTLSIPARSLSCLPRKHALSGASAQKGLRRPARASGARFAAGMDLNKPAVCPVRDRKHQQVGRHFSRATADLESISGDRKAFFGCGYLFSAMAFKWILQLLLFSKNGLRRTMNASRTLHGRPRTWSLTALWTNA